MRKQTLIIATILCFLSLTWLPCQADDILYGCAKKKNGQLRIVSDPSNCLKSEYSVSLHGTTGPVEQIGQLACVTANIGISEDGTEVEVEIAYQKNITITDWSEVFDVLVGEPNPEGGYKFGSSCKNEWIMVSCTQSDGEPLDIAIKDSGCYRDEEIPKDPASIYVTCCTQRTY